MGIGLKNRPVKNIVNNLDPLFLGSVTPASVPTGTGLAFWLATQNGTYTNFGGLVVSSNSFALISRDFVGNFTLSQTPLDLTDYEKNPNYQKGISGVINFNTGTIAGLSLTDHCIIIKTYIIDPGLIPTNTSIGTFFGRALDYYAGYISSRLNAGGSIQCHNYSDGSVIVANKPVAYSDIASFFSAKSKNIISSGQYAYSNTPSIIYTGHANVVLGDIIVLKRALTLNEVNQAFYNPNDFLSEAVLYFPASKFTTTTAFEEVNKKTYNFGIAGTINI